LGIECDGAYYHSSSTARDRDRLRQQVLEDLNWNIYRVWSTDWFKNPRLEFEKLISAIEKAKEGTFCKKKLNSSFEIQYKNHLSRKEQTPVTAYSKTPTHPKLPSENFYVTDIDKICFILRKVINHEGPIHQDEAERRVIQHWGIRAVGSRVKEILEEAEQVCIKEKLFKKKNNFYWPTNMNKPPIRQRDSIDIKDIELIAPEEVGEAALIALEKEYTMPKDSLIEQTASILGFGRVTEDISKYIWEAIKKYKKEHKIAEVNDKLSLVKERIADCPSCGQKLRFPDKSNIEISCPKCKKTFNNV